MTRGPRAGPQVAAGATDARRIWQTTLERSVIPGQHHNGQSFMKWRINVGCGQTPTPGWLNFDNSLSLRLAQLPLLAAGLRRLGTIDASHSAMADFCRRHNIIRADATRGIPLPDRSVEVLYSSHMIEHLDPEEARAFLQEARRLLQSDGILRIAAPDIRIHVGNYVDSGDAEAFVRATLLVQPKPRGLRGKLRYLVAGPRNHLWMYDGPSLAALVLSVGFEGARVLKAGETTIPDPGALNLRERESESVYVEARNP